MKGIIFQPAKAAWLHSLAKDPAKLAALGGEPQTRRVIRFPKCAWGETPEHYLGVVCELHVFTGVGGWGGQLEPVLKVGDRVYVKESYTTYRTRTEGEQADIEEKLGKFARGECTDIVADALALPVASGPPKVMYKGDYGDWADNPDSDLGPWANPMFMPERFARTILEVTGVKVERARDISEVDALLEGFLSDVVLTADGQDYTGTYACERFWDQFEKLNGKGSLDKWCWVYSLKPVEAR